MNRTLRLVGVLAAMLLPLQAFAQSIPVPMSALNDALRAARRADISELVGWAARASSPAATDADAAVKAAIVALSPPDRDAVLYWLLGHGRAALHARGASDADIGVPFYPIDYVRQPAPFPASVTPLVVPETTQTSSPTPRRRPRTQFGLLGALLPALQIPIASSSSSSSTSSTTQSGDTTEYNATTQSSGTSVSVGGNPWEAVGSLIDASVARAANGGSAAPAQPWRTLPFAMSALGAARSPVSVNRGFAAVRTDGTEGAACISFVNDAAIAATRVSVDIEILDALGLIQRVAALNRTGQFAPGAEIGGPTGPQTIAQARANCVIDGENALADRSDPFAGASAVAFAVREVRFVDGTVWLQPGANSTLP